MIGTDLLLLEEVTKSTGRAVEVEVANSPTRRTEKQVLTMNMGEEP